ncbi:MAG: AI-2E family transporter [Nanoarchaeota archaeon]
MTLSTDTRVWKILFLITIMLTLVFGVFFYFRNLFIIFVVGFILILITERVINWYELKIKKKFKLRHWQSSGIAYLALFIFFFILFYFLFLSLAEISTVFSQLNPSNPVGQAYIDNFKEILPERVSNILIEDSFLVDLQLFVFNFFANFLLNFSKIFFTALLVIPLMFFAYFNRKQKIMNFIFEAVPKKFHRGFLRSSAEMGSKLKDFFTAKIIESLIVALICSLGFMFIGIKGGLFLGILAGFLNIIPYVGPIMGAIPPLIIGLISGPEVGLYVLITVLFAQLVDNFYLIPFMISDKVKIDPLLSIVLILVGAQLFGVFGMVFALPVFIVYKIVLKEAYEELVAIYNKK